MDYISSDTNVWIDFDVIGKLELPFKLQYIYLMNEDAAEDELLSPPYLGRKLVELGLQKVSLSEEEFYLAEEFKVKYLKLSTYDCVALAIAKKRGITLLSGDGPLRKAAVKESVDVKGTIGIIDELYANGIIEMEEYKLCLIGLKENNGGKVRLPLKEIEGRLKMIG